METVITQLFGTYTPLVDSTGAYISGLAGVDWQWIFGMLLFLVVLEGFFKILNSIIHGG